MDLEWTWVDTASAVMFAVHAVVAPLACAIAVSSLDDLFVDLAFAGRWISRRRFRGQRATVRALPPVAAPGQIAVFIPAWDESDIIGDMLRATLERWSGDDRFRLFVGWYANDLPTGRAVAAIDHRVIPVIVPHDGPTTKADCLNHLWAACVQHERERNQRFTAILLHDAEDLVSRDELTMIRYLVQHRGKALVQFPVIPVPVPGSSFVSGHYLDEFAETHAKDMVVREWMGASFPAAGVGCAFSREALGAVAAQRAGLPFRGESMTEDYDLGLQVSSHAPAAFVRIRPEPHQGIIGTREHFPDQFWRAVRQKSRWLRGITLEGWEAIGWQGSIANRYWLARDRKAILTFYLNASAYGITGIFVLLFLWQQLTPLALHFDVAHLPSWLAPLLLFNFIILSWRLLVRGLFVAQLSGPVQALLSVPRAFVGNMINICAAGHAVQRWVRTRWFASTRRWDKTEHRSPIAIKERA